MKISVEELRILFNLVIKKLEADKVNEVDFNYNEYWIILTNEWNNFKKVPEPAVGSLQDDIENLKRAIEENEIFGYSDLDRLSAVLRAISELKAPSD